MPAIYLFQRRTLYGGDDLHLLAMSTAAVRLFQLFCYSILLYHTLNHFPSGTEDETIKSAGYTTTIQDDMYLRRRRLLAIENGGEPLSAMHLGITLLEYAWMDATRSGRGLEDNNDNNECRNSQFFPLFLLIYAVAGTIFGVASLVLMYKIHRTSSMGCPTFHRHPRTETIQQLLEWMFLPLNVVHALIWCVGATAMMLAYNYSPCEDYTVSSSVPSTWFVVIWISAAVLLLLSQGFEIIWNFGYVWVLYYHDPHALHWSPNNSGMTNYDTGFQAAVEAQYEHHELVEQMWADRCQNCCRCLGMGTCYIFGGQELLGGGAMHYANFARAMADYLETRGVLDVVPSDILAGFIVLQQVQHQRRLQVRHEVLSEHFSCNNFSLTGVSNSTRLNNHRANVRSPNGMQLQRSSSQDALSQQLLRGQPENDATSNDSLLSQHKTQQRPVLLKSMGSGSIHNLEDDTSEKIIVDHSLPPAPPNPHKAIASGAPSPSAPTMHLPFAQQKSFQRLLSEHNHADVAILEEGARYSKYALAIYTWYLYLYVNPITGIPKLCMKAWNSSKCGCCWMSYFNDHNHASTGLPHSASSGNLHHAATNQGRKRQWEGDNICEVHKHALLLAANLENEADLVYVQFKSSFNENPYCILLDHETQAVVLAVRGTFSLEDCLTDVLLEPESMEPLGDEFGFAEMARGQYCHGGVLSCARNVYRDLKRHGSLDYLLGTKYPHYQLRLVGHSLGAATSTVLGFMLRQTYPTLRCYNYSPPGCTFTWDLAIQCQSWCTSFVLDCEVVPRMSFDALEYLRDEVLDLIGRIKVSKIEVARRVVTKTLWCKDKNAASVSGVRHEYDLEAASTKADEIGLLLDELLLPPGECLEEDAAATSFRQQLEQFQSVQSERRLARGAPRAIRLFPPGKILHLVKTDEEQNCMVNVAKCLTCCMSNAGSLYTPVWIGNGDLNEIVISPTMGTDHFPDRMVEELQGIVNNFGVSPRFR